MQESKNQAVQFCSLCVNIPEVFGASTCIATLQTQESFTTHLNLQRHELVKDFTAVIGQDGRLIHVGDYIELHSAQYEVSCKSVMQASVVEHLVYIHACITH